MRSSYKNQFGVVQTLLIVFLVMLWIVTTFLFFVFHSMEGDIARKADLATAETKRIRDREQELNKKLHLIQCMVGFYEVSDEEITDITRVRVDVNRLAKNLNTINDSQKGPGTRQEYGLMELPYSSEIQTDRLLMQRYAVNLEEVIYAFEKRIYQLQKDLKTSQSELNKLIFEKESKIREREQITASLRKISNHVKSQKNTLDSKFEAQFEVIREQMTKAEKDKLAAETKIEEIEKELRQQKLDFDNEISNKKSEIRKLQAAKYGRASSSKTLEEKKFDASGEEADAKVVFADPQTKTIYIDLGKENEVVRGLKFDVYRPAEKGTRVYKGHIEVSKVMDNVSMVAIVEQNELDPITPGDLLVNPVFREESPVYFAFAGDFISTTKQKATMIIESMGGVVESEVSAKTNFVVYGAQKAEEARNYLDALRFQLPLMPEKTLLRYIGD